MRYNNTKVVGVNVDQIKLRSSYYVESEQCLKRDNSICLVQLAVDFFLQQ